MTTEIGRLRRRPKLIPMNDFIDFWLFSLGEDQAQRARAAARARLREILADYHGESADTLELAEGVHGKPRLAGSAWAFNLAHCGDRALVAVAHGAGVGVDLERERDDVDVVPIVKHYFSPHEREDFERQPAARRCAWFFRQWVAKEAVVKAHGGGLTIAPNLFAVQFEDAHRGRVLSPGADPGDHWHVRMLDAGPGWHAAVAFDGLPRALRFRSRDTSRR